MNPHDTLEAAEALGLSLPSPAYLVGMVLFSLAGLAAWRYGKATGRPRTRALGVALMLYSYVVGSTWLLYAVGGVLCAGIWWDSRR